MLKIDRSLISSTSLGLLNDTPDTNQTASFKAYLQNSLQRVNELEHQTEVYTQKLATGELENIHEAMIASQKADISLQYVMQIRNKILDAYREIMRMQI